MAEGPELALLSFNIRYATTRDGWHRWGLRRRLLAGLIRGMPWDVCGLQEVLSQQRRYLRRRLPGTAWYGVARADGFDDGEQSAVLVRGSGWTVHSWQTRWLSEVSDQVGSLGWDARIPRVATVVRLRHPESDRTVGLVNAHFDHAAQRARIESGALIASWVRAEPDLAWIVLGDLNDTPASAPLEALYGAGLRQALPDDAGGTVHSWSGRTDRKRIDHILVDESLEVLDAKVDTTRPLGVLPSDHWPVTARVRLS